MTDVRGTADVGKDLERYLAPEYISYRKGEGGKQYAYVEGHEAISLANKIFGWELMGSVELDEAPRVAVEHGYTERNDRNNYNERQDDEEAQNEENPDEQERDDDDDPDNNPRRSSNPWHRIRPFIFDKLLPPLGTAVCILHITAMLGYVLLMNDPAPPKPSFIAGHVPSSSSPLTARLTLH
jgi:hypothetical protein